MTDDNAPEPNGKRDVHVQVLTAEVRTLMVGSRQVTLSVYNQLDFVPHSRIEPFGRVNPKDAAEGRIYVVGRDAEAGTLVRAVTPEVRDELDAEPYRARAREVATEALSPIIVAHQQGYPLDDAIRAAARAFSWLVSDQGLVTEYDAMIWLGRTAEKTGWKDRGGSYADQQARALLRTCRIELSKTSADWTIQSPPGSAEESAADLLTEFADAKSAAEGRCAAIRKQWSDLPLIVLAGLR